MSVGNFSEDGYQIIRGVIPAATIAHVRSFLEQEQRAVVDMLRPLGLETDESGQPTPENLQRTLDSLGPDKESSDTYKALTGHFPLRTRLSRELWGLFSAPDLQAAVRKALGEDEICVHMPPTARFVWPHSPLAGVPAHQDISYNQHMKKFVVAWAPLVPIDAQCGGVAVYEGTGKLPEVRDLGRGIWLDAVPTQGYRRIECQPMLPGDVLLLNELVVHESMANLSNQTRLSVDMRFFGKSIRSGKHSLDLQTYELVEPA